MLVALLLACVPTHPHDSSDTGIPAAPALRDLAVAERSSCAVTGEGEVWCWGTIPSYRGTGSIYTLPGALRVDGLAPVDHLSISRNLHCAVFLDGTAGCWDGAAWTWDTGEPVLTFVGPLTPIDAAAIVATDWSVYTLSEAGVVEQWNDLAAPGEEVLSSMTSVAASPWLYVCGLDTDGHAVCDGDLTPPSAAPAFTSLAVGDARACGVDAAGALTCWNRQGAESPAAALPALASVRLGWEHGCGLTTDGGVVCWGESDASVGDLSTLGGLDLLATGTHHDCAADAEGGVWCWGDGDWGQLGAPEVSGGPVAVEGLP